jgi:hypothetical protein
MKTYLLLAAVLMLPWFGAAISPVLLNSGSLSVKWMVSTQGLVNATELAKTNTTATSTNTIQVTKSTVTNSMFQTADLMGLLENSFNKTFPAGSQLVLNRVGNYYSIFLTDASGTNVVQPLSTNLIIGAKAGEQPVSSDIQTLVTKSTTSGTSSSANESETTEETVLLFYDDTALTTGDGTHSQFQIDFLVVRKSLEDFVAGTAKDVVKLQGIGSGTIHGQNVIIQGSGAATITGSLAAP